MDLTRRFERSEVWAVDPASNPHELDKSRLTKALIPPGVHSILDVGCGNGVFAAELVADFIVAGIDGSRAALSKATVPVVQSWIDRLPIQNNAVDLVLCSEVLEHLPSSSLPAAVSELQRVTRRWIIITVPFEEHLALRNMWCDNCHHPFHIYGHVQRFTLHRLRTMFAEYTLTAWTHCGDTEPTYHPTLLPLRQYIGDRWFYYAPAFPSCPRCQTTTFEQHYGNRLANWCDRLNRIFVSRYVRYKPYWILTLWEKS